MYSLSLYPFIVLRHALSGNTYRETYMQRYIQRCIQTYTHTCTQRYIQRYIYRYIGTGYRGTCSYICRHR